MNNIPDFLVLCEKNNHKEIIAAAEGYRPLLATWLLELTLFLGWYKNANINRSWIIENEAFLQITGINVGSGNSIDEDNMINGRPVKHTDINLARILKKNLTNFRKQSLRDDHCLFKNINLLGQVIGLNQAEKAILCFASILNVFHSFKDALSCASYKTSLHEVGVIIAHLSGQTEEDVIIGLRQDSTLRASGIIEVNKRGEDLEDWLELLTGMGSLLTQPHDNVEALISRFLSRTNAPSLQLQNFLHLVQDAHTLKMYLESALQTRAQGTNILLYGIPGTGKTEFVKALAHELGADLYEISYSNEEGCPITGIERLQAYNLCQRILVQKENALLMFDEIEDVFPSQGGLRALFGIQTESSEEEVGKAWINRTLERNRTPAIWITNNANLDNAYLRRFDYSIQFLVPPLKVRMEIARHHLSQFNPTEAWLAEIALNEQTTPAQYERASKVAMLSSKGDDEYARQIVKLVLDRSATLLGQKQVPIRNTLHTSYDLRFANTSMSMPDIISGLKKRRESTFCFYGPTGTGKSELARHIADELERPFILRRASDILSKWLGEAEHNIAKMFVEARQQDAVLILDEADSFLADRRDATQSWEVSHVNELLTQMEVFNGIFICTTNLMERLDPASLRRFSFKVKFDYLNKDQRWEMFKKELVRLGGRLSGGAELKSQVCSLTNLTPGDFAVAARQFVILDMPINEDELFRQLLAECRLKTGDKRGIGFLV